MGGSSKKTTQKTVNKVTTETKTSVRDIGLTGQTAVALAEVLESGSVERAAINADTVNKLVQATGEGWNRLVGAAGKFVDTAAAQAQATRTQASETAGQVLAAGERAGERSGEERDTMKLLTTAAVLITGIAGLAIWRAGSS